jgi:hypothetical protein
VATGNKLGIELGNDGAGMTFPVIRSKFLAKFLANFLAQSMINTGRGLLQECNTHELCPPVLPTFERVDDGHPQTAVRLAWG